MKSMSDKNDPGHRPGIFSVQGKIRNFNGTATAHLFGGKGDL